MRYRSFVAAEVIKRILASCQSLRLVTLAATVCALVLLSGCSRKVHAFSNEPEPDITGSPSDPPVELKSELKPDVHYAFHLETDNSYRSSKWKLGIGSSETHFETDYGLTVTNEMRNGHHQLDLQFLALVMQVFSGDETKLYFDSENRAVPMTGDFAEAMRNMINGHFGAELSKKDTLVKVYGLDDMVANSTTKKNLRKASAWVHQLFTTSLVRHMVEFNHLPDKSVHIGDKWAQTNDLNNGFVAQANYTFRGWQWHDERKCALIEFEGTISPPSAKSKTDVEDSNFYGRYWFDPDAGITTDSIVHEQYTWSRKGANGEKFPTTQTVSVKLDSMSTPRKSVATN